MPWRTLEAPDHDRQYLRHRAHPRPRRPAGRAYPGLDPALLARVEVTPTREAAHGDMATNAALIAAKPARQPPARIAATLAAALAARRRSPPPSRPGPAS